MACWKCSTLSVALYSEIKVLSTLAVTQSFILFDDENNVLFLTAGRFKKNLKNLYQQLHNSSKWLGCDGYKLSNHNDALKKTMD